MSHESLDTQERKILTEEDKLESVVLHLDKNIRTTSEELKNLAGMETDLYERGDYVAVARALSDLGYVDSHIENGEMIWRTSGNFDYDSVMQGVDKALKSREKSSGYR